MDAAAFEILFRTNFVPLCAWCQHKFNFDLETARDAVHTAFARFWENRQSISIEDTSTAYLYKIVNNVCIDLIRREQVKDNYLKIISLQAPRYSEEDVSLQYDIKQLAADIENALSELPEQMRIIFELSRNNGLKYAEIAQQLNISVKTVETQMSRALAKMRVKLAQYLPVIGWLLF